MRVKHTELMTESQELTGELQHADRTKSVGVADLQRDLIQKKDENHELQTQIGVVDAERIEAVKKLRLLQQKRQFTHTNAESQKYDV